MKFIKTQLPGAYIIKPEPIEDERGFFARSFCKQAFKRMGLATDFVQCNISFNKKKGTLRGMHYQLPPYREAKLVSCLRGSIYDVIIDLRAKSASYCQWDALELNDRNRLTLYIPKEFAHGFLTLEDNSEVFYQISEFYHPEAAAGIRWNDSTFKISWGIENPIISEKDNKYPDWKGFF